MKLSDDVDGRPEANIGRVRPVDVVVADSHPLVRTGLRALLERAGRLRVVGEAGSMNTLRMEVHRTRPGVVIVDIDLPGVQSGADLRELPVPVLLVGEDEDLERVVRALSDRVRGFVRKSQPAELISAVDLVMAGQASLSPAITSRLLDFFLAECSFEALPPLAVALTRREHDVLRLMAEGRSTGQIAEQLVVQTSTVKTHVYHLLRKLGVNDRAQAVAFAYRRGIVSAADRRRVSSRPGAGLHRRTEAV
jgi:DNA-binding NarL/FixJ family response regulator